MLVRQFVNNIHMIHEFSANYIENENLISVTFIHSRVTDLNICVVPYFHYVISC